MMPQIMTLQMQTDPTSSAAPISESSLPNGAVPTVELTESQRLLIAAQAGDYDAFGDMWALMEPELRRFVRRLIGGNDEASYAEDDVLQTVFIALYRHLARIQPMTLRPYSFRIARNRCYDELRRAGRHSPMSLDDEPTELRVSFTHQDVPQSEELAHWLLLQLEVREAMDGLPELQRQALIMFAENEMSYAEIAEAMQVSIGTVKSRLHHAKRGLRARLKPETAAALDEAFGSSHLASVSTNEPIIEKEDEQ